MTKLITSPTSASPLVADVLLRGDLKCRAELVVHADGGRPIGIDCRLYRRVSTNLSGDAWSPTGAGFRLPLDRVAEFIGRLMAVAKAGSKLDESLEAPRMAGVPPVNKADLDPTSSGETEAATAQ